MGSSLEAQKPFRARHRQLRRPAATRLPWPRRLFCGRLRGLQLCLSWVFFVPSANWYQPFLVSFFVRTGAVLVFLSHSMWLHCWQSSLPMDREHWIHVWMDTRLYPPVLGDVTFLPRRQTLNLSNISWSPVLFHRLSSPVRATEAATMFVRVSSSLAGELVPVLSLFLRTHPVLCLCFCLRSFHVAFILSSNRHYRWTGIVIHVVIGLYRLARRSR
jgi:hypothetical protein